MKEKIARIIESLDREYMMDSTDYQEITDQILSFFREEIEKLKPLSDEEILDAVCSVYPPYDDGRERTLAQGSLESEYRDAQRLAVAQAQLAKTKEDLRKVME